MSVGDWWENVWNALVTKVKTVSDFGESVFWSEKYDVVNFPAAYVCPTGMEGTPVTFRETLWNPSFEILIVVENVNIKSGMIAVGKLAGKIIDAILADRTLSDVVHNTECGPVIFHPRGLGRGTEQHWASVLVRCERKQ